MSIAPGYVHISLRNAQRSSRPAVPKTTGNAASSLATESAATITNARADAERPAAGDHTEAEALGAPPAVVAGTGQHLRGVGPDNVAHGFVLYLGVDEEAAAANGISLATLAQKMREYARSLVPQAQSYAAVAIAPADAPGTPLEVVRSTFGDPTVTPGQRTEAGAAPAPERDTHGMLIDLARREVLLDGQTLGLTYKEFELLNYLVENDTRTVTREELLDRLWPNPQEAPNERTIDVHVRRLRSKLGRLATTVRTIRGQGYRFYDHPEVVVWAAPEYSI